MARTMKAQVARNKKDVATKAKTTRKSKAQRTAEAIEAQSIALSKARDAAYDAGTGFDAETFASTPLTPKINVPPGVAEAFVEWQTKGTGIAELATRLNIKLYQTLRHHFIKLAGGKPQFFALRDAGAGGKAVRAVGVPGQPSTFTGLDDSTVPTVTGAKGWTHRRVWAATTANVEKVGTIACRELLYLVHINTEGVEYVEAKARERADLIIMTDVGMPDLKPARMRYLSTSHVVKAATEAETAAERGHEAKAAKKAAAKAHTAKLAKIKGAK